MIGSTRLELTASLFSTPKISRLVVTSQINSYCGTPVPKKMKRSVLVQTRDRVRRARTLEKTNTVLCTELTIFVGRVRTRNSFASRLRLKRECEHDGARSLSANRQLSVDLYS